MPTRRQLRRASADEKFGHGCGFTIVTGLLLLIGALFWFANAWFYLNLHGFWFRIDGNRIFWFGVALIALFILWRQLLPYRAAKAMLDLRTSFGGRELLDTPKIRFLWRGRYTWHIGWQMPVGVTVSGMAKYKEAVDQKCGVDTEWWYEQHGAFGLVKLHHMKAGVARVPKAAHYNDWRKKKAPKGILMVPIGPSRAGPLWVDLGRVYNLLIAGQVGGGKSAQERAVVTSLAERYSPKELEFGLIDLQGGIELNTFVNLPHVGKRVGFDLPSCVQVLTDSRQEIADRTEKMREAGVENIQRWNETHPDDRMPFRVIVVDELAMLTVMDGITAGHPDRHFYLDGNRMLFQGVSLGRKCGIFYIFALQRPDKDALPGLIKNNATAVVCFRMLNAVNSAIVLGQGNGRAATLPPNRPGLGIWQWGSHEAEFQGIWLEKDAALQHVRRIQTKYDAASAKPWDPNEHHTFEQDWEPASHHESTPDGEPVPEWINHLQGR